MKVLMYAVRPDEMESINKYSKEFGLDITTVNQNFDKTTAHLAKGYEAISILGNCIASKEALEEINEYGIKVIANRSAGYDKIDLETAKKLNILVSNVPSYSPNAISEFAVMSAMLLSRNYKMAFNNVVKQNFSLKGLIGVEIRKSTVGVVGTGKIGYEAIKGFRALGAKVVAYDMYPNKNLDVEYVSFDKLLEVSDFISLHIPQTKDNYHLFNKETINKMKDNSFLINTSRGGLVNVDDVLQALENGKLSGYAMDVYEKEVGIFHTNKENEQIPDQLSKLIKNEKVLVTPHYAFYTTEAVSNMVEMALANIHSYMKNKKLLTEIEVQ